MLDLLLRERFISMSVTSLIRVSDVIGSLFIVVLYDLSNIKNDSIFKIFWSAKERCKSIKNDLKNKKKQFWKLDFILKKLDWYDVINH